MFIAKVENFVFLPLDGGDLTISVKLVASKMIGLDDVPSTSSDSVASSSCEEDIHELYDWCDYHSQMDINVPSHQCILQTFDFKAAAITVSCKYCIWSCHCCTLWPNVLGGFSDICFKVAISLLAMSPMRLGTVIPFWMVTIEDFLLCKPCCTQQQTMNCII